MEPYHITLLLAFAYGATLAFKIAEPNAKTETEISLDSENEDFVPQIVDPLSIDEDTLSRIARSPKDAQENQEGSELDDEEELTNSRLFSYLDATISRIARSPQKSEGKGKGKEKGKGGKKEEDLTDEYLASNLELELDDSLLQRIVRSPQSDSESEKGVGKDKRKGKKGKGKGKKGKGKNEGEGGQDEEVGLADEYLASDLKVEVEDSLLQRIARSPQDDAKGKEGGKGKGKGQGKGQGQGKGKDKKKEKGKGKGKDKGTDDEEEEEEAAGLADEDLTSDVAFALEDSLLSRIVRSPKEDDEGKGKGMGKGKEKHIDGEKEQEAFAELEAHMEDRNLESQIPSALFNTLLTRISRSAETEDAPELTGLESELEFEALKLDEELPLLETVLLLDRDARSPQGPPEGKGRPEGTGPPEDKGRPGGKGRPAGKGRPEGNGKPSLTDELTDLESEFDFDIVKREARSPQGPPDGKGRPEGKGNRKEGKSSIADTRAEIMALAASEDLHLLSQLAYHEVGVDEEYLDRHKREEEHCKIHSKSMPKCCGNSSLFEPTNEDTELFKECCEELAQEYKQEGETKRKRHANDGAHRGKHHEFKSCMWKCVQKKKGLLDEKDNIIEEKALEEVMKKIEETWKKPIAKQLVSKCVEFANKPREKKEHGPRHVNEGAEDGHREDASQQGTEETKGHGPKCKNPGFKFAMCMETEIYKQCPAEHKKEECMKKGGHGNRRHGDKEGHKHGGHQKGRHGDENSPPPPPPSE